MATHSSTAAWRIPWTVRKTKRYEDRRWASLPPPVGRSNCQHSSDHGDNKGVQKKKNIYFCFIDYTKVFDCMDHNKLWKILEEMGKPDHLTCLLRNLYASQEATIRTRHVTTDWFKIGKGVWQGCILSLCLFNFCAEYIMWNAGLDEWQAEIRLLGKISTSDMQMIPL